MIRIQWERVMIIERSILIFPAVQPAAPITSWRRAYDPLVDQIRPHISLVFPFASPISDADLVQLVTRTCRSQRSFALTAVPMGGDFEHGYVWLNIDQGAPVLTALHDALYATSALRPGWRSDIPYRPHITIGQVPVTQAAALAQQLTTPAQCFRAEIATISIEHILPSGKSDEFAKICLEKWTKTPENIEFIR